MTTKTMTLGEVAALKSVSRRTVSEWLYNLTAQGKPLPEPIVRAWQEGREWRFEVRTEDVEASRA